MRFVLWSVKLAAMLGIIFIVGGLMISPDWSVTRAIQVQAPISRIYENVGQFRSWAYWSPWRSEKNPSMHYTYEGPAMGVGSKQIFKSEKMGSGLMKMTHADPASGVGYDLIMTRGARTFKLHGEIQWVAVGPEVEIRWTDSGQVGDGYLARWLGLVIQTFIGQDLEKALLGLKARLEQS